MIRILLLGLLLGISLGACSSKSTKDQAATVEDKSGGAAKEGAQTHAAGAEAASGMAALNDPNSPLATRTLYFDYDSSDVLPAYQSTVEAHAAFLAANPGVTMSLEGHADERGSREYNLALGERRAQSVKRQMVLLGASAQQIRTTSYGEERPAVEGHDEAAWSKNRRVELVY